MSKTVELEAKLRAEVGTKASRKLRATGEVPAVLYGHGEQNVNLVISGENLVAQFEAGHRLYDLKVGGKKETALLVDLQWDPMGDYLMHADFARTSLTDIVRTSVPVLLRGVAAGVKSGGVLAKQHMAILLEGPAGQMPQELRADISKLEIGDALHVRDIEVPAGLKVIDDGAVVVAGVTTSQQEILREETEGEVKAPEVLTEKKEKLEGGEAAPGAAAPEQPAKK